MSSASNEGDRIPMSQRERDRLRVLHSVLEGQRTQAEAARLLRCTPRHVRRLLQRLQQGGTRPSFMGCAQITPGGEVSAHSGKADRGLFYFNQHEDISIAFRQHPKPLA